MVFVSAAPNVLENVKKVPGNSDAIYRLNSASILQQKTLYSNWNISANRIAACMSLELGDKQTFVV